MYHPCHELARDRLGASLKGRIRPPHSNIISMEVVMDPAGVLTVCFIRI
eukprot:COSAG01_NODE_7160_length_3324_cov_192.600620_4_plen_49_part_00